jgi:UDP-N-acetylmuramate dehydrogenase
MNVNIKPNIQSVLLVTRGDYKLNYNLAHLSWFKVGGNAEIFFKPLDSADLSLFLSLTNGNIPITVIGAGSNILIRDGGIEGAVIKLGRNFTQIELTEDGFLSAGAGCLNYNLAQFCLNNSIKGFEFLVGIPGTIGGGVAMNAGAYNREFKDIVVEIEALDSKGNAIKFTNEEAGFRYRANSLPQDVIITKAKFKIEKGEYDSINAMMKEINTQRLATQPIKEKTSGSTFANPIGRKAWQLIDEAALRGYRIGGAQISELHCNFMINCSNATAADLEDLGEYIQRKVQENSGVLLEWEIKRLGIKK